jgi:DNA-binding CsgD family transcriptional regulator
MEVQSESNLISPEDEFGKFLSSIDPESAQRFTNYFELQSLYDSLEAAEAAGDNRRRVVHLSEIANNLRLTGNYNEGILFYRSALNLSEEDDMLIKAQLYHGLAAIYYELYLHIRKQTHFLDSASRIADKAFLYAEPTGASLQLSDVLNLQGAIKIQKGRYSEAIDQLNKSLNIKHKHENYHDLAVLTNLSFAHFQLRSFDSALIYSQETYIKALNAGDLIFTVNSLELLSNIYHTIGDTTNANKYEREMQSLIRQDDHIVKALVMKQLYQKYQHRIDDKQLQGLSGERNYLVRLSLILLNGAGLLMIVLLAIFFMLRQSKKLHKSQVQLLLEKQRAAELQVRNVTLELEEKKREEHKLNEELEYKQGLLALKMLQISKMIDFLNQLKEVVNKLKNNTHIEDSHQAIDKIEKEISIQLKGNIWEEFEMLYAAGNNTFIGRLMAIHPELSLHEKRLSYLIMSGYSTKEIANILSKTYRSVEMARHRLRTKLGLDKNTTLEAYFSRLISQSS